MDMTAIRGVMKHCRIFRTFRSAEIQKSAREFSHGLNLKAKNVVIMNFNENCTKLLFSSLETWQENFIKGSE